MLYWTLQENLLMAIRPNLCSRVTGFPQIPSYPDEICNFCTLYFPQNEIPTFAFSFFTTFWGAPTSSATIAYNLNKRLFYKTSLSKQQQYTIITLATYLLLLTKVKKSRGNNAYVNRIQSKLCLCHIRNKVWLHIFTYTDECKYLSRGRVIYYDNNQNART